MPKSAKRRKQAHTSRDQTPTRRSLLQKSLLLGGGAAIVGGLGLFSVNAVQATVAEQDLTRIGQGKPVIVQIHDPQCALCTALQRETRRALRALPDEALTYLVANIRNEEGAAFANRHGQPHVTLLLMDGDGAVQEVITGVQDSAVLLDAFRAHLARNS